MLSPNLVSILVVTWVFFLLISLKYYLSRRKRRLKQVQSPTVLLPWLLISPSEGVLPDEGQDFSIFTTADLNPVTSVQQQSIQSGEVILWVGFTKKNGFKNFEELVNEATRYSNIHYVFVYEEIFWEPPGRLALGEREIEILKAALYSREHGLAPVIIAMPDVILHPDFQLQRINTYSVIVISDHPSVNPTIRLNDNITKCIYSSNLTTNLLYLSVQRLRDLGFDGQIWYAYQAFGLNDVPSETLMKDFNSQRETLLSAKELGIDAIVPYGLYLGESEISRKPNLFQGHGTRYETLLRPPIV